MSQNVPPLEYQPDSYPSPHAHESGLHAESSEKIHAALLTSPTPTWTPISLRKWFAISVLTLMVLVAAALEIALHFSNVQHGWNVSNAVAATTGLMHYVYTLPPVAVAMIIVGLWAWTDVDIKELQPYIDLAYGNAPASRTLLIDYSNTHPALVSISAWHHRHYIVALSSLMVLVGLAIQPLAASLFTVKDTWSSAPDVNVTTYEVLGLNPTFNNLTAFSTAAGFIQGSVLYNATPPNFVQGVWSIARIQVPSDKVANGTMSANSTSIQSSANCIAGDSNSIVAFTNNTGFTLSGTAYGCSIVVPVQTTAQTQYGVEVISCPNTQTPDPFKPVVFWSLTHPDASSTAIPLFSMVYCSPTITLYNVAVEVALQTGDLQNATVTSNFGEPNNITDPNGLMQGRAFNGVAFDLTGADPFVQNRAQASKTGLVSAVVQKAEQAPGALVGQMQTSGIVGITDSIYTLYLSLVARDNYFVPQEGAEEVKIMTFQPKLWMVDATVHLMAAILVIFAALGATIHFLHRRMRDFVVLPRRPGTLASAASFTAGSNITDVLDGPLDEASLIKALKHKRFRIDKETGRIMMEGDEGFESGEALLNPRRSMLRQMAHRLP